MELHAQHWCEEVLEGVQEALVEQHYTLQRAFLDGEKKPDFYRSVSETFIDWI